MSKRTDSAALGSLGAGAVTGLALAVQTGLSAVVGVVVAREIGRDAVTDGFFAAYAVYVVAVLAAGAIRVTVMPPFARSRARKTLASEVAAYALTVGALAVPALAVGVLVPGQFAWLLTGNGPQTARDTAADVLPWMLLAGVLQLYAGLAASALAALDDYVTPAAGYVLGSAAGLALILARIGDDGVAAVSWGLALNGAIAVSVSAVALALRARAEGMPGESVRPAQLALGARLAEVGTGVAVPFAVQAIYLVCVPLAGREGEGALTTFSYAYLLMAAVVAVSASSLGFVTSVPLTRAGLDASRTGTHVVSSSWLAVVAVGGTAGAFAIAGGEVVEVVLGSAYGADVGSELGWLVVALAPWAVVTVGVSVTFPLPFVAGRTRRLPLLGLAVLALQVPLAVAGQAAFGLSGLALALAVTTAALFAGLLSELGALELGARGFAYAAAVVALTALVAFLPPSLVLGSIGAAAAGLAIYAALLVAVRPQGLRDAWSYLRALS